MGLTAGPAPARARLLRFWPAAVLLMAWAPLILLVAGATFAFHNDYVSVTLAQHDFVRHPERGQLMTVGRPIGAALLQLYHRSFDSLPAIGIAHLLGLGFGVSLSLTLYAFLRRALAVDRSLALAVAAGLPMLPSVTIGILWMTTQPPGLLCILYVAVLYALHAVPGRHAPWIRAPLLAAWLAAFLLYPPSALFVCALILARLMFAAPGADGGTALLRAVAIEAGIVLLSMLAYLIFMKVLYDPLMQGFGVTILRTADDESLIRRYDFHLAGLWAAISKTFGHLAFSLRLWAIDDRAVATGVFGILAAVGVAGQLRLLGSTRLRLAAGTLACALPVLAIAPVAVSGFDGFIYRAASGAQACLAVLAFRGLGEASRFWVIWRRSRIEPSLARHVRISAAPPVIAGMLAVIVLAAWQIRPVIADKAGELAFVVATIEDFARRAGGVPKGTKTEAVLDIRDRDRGAVPPYYDLGLSGRQECCWAFLAMAGVDRYEALRTAGAIAQPRPAAPGQTPGSLVFDFRRVPPLP